MHFRASRPISLDRAAVRPLSRRMMWKFCGPSPSVTPDHREVYGFMRSPVEERGSSCRNTPRSSKFGSSFSMPMTVIRVSGRVRHIRPLPSDSTMETVPVSAQPKLAPEMATLASMNCWRRYLRAASASSAGSWVKVSSVFGIFAAKMSRISARLRWIAGTRMWEGKSSPSCTMSSARSVSCAKMPAFSSSSFRAISWVAMDLILTTLSSPVARTRSWMISLASLESRAQWTWPPRAVTFCSNCSSSSGMRAATSRLMVEPASRRSCQSSTSSTTACRFTRMVVVAYW